MVRLELWKSHLANFGISSRTITVCSVEASSYLLSGKGYT